MTDIIKYARNLEEKHERALLFAPAGRIPRFSRGLKATRNSGEAWNVVTWGKKPINSMTCFRQLSLSSLRCIRFLLTIVGYGSLIRRTICLRTTVRFFIFRYALGEIPAVPKGRRHWDFLDWLQIKVNLYKFILCLKNLFQNYRSIFKWRFFF